MCVAVRASAEGTIPRKRVAIRIAVQKALIQELSQSEEQWEGLPMPFLAEP